MFWLTVGSIKEKRVRQISLQDLLAGSISPVGGFLFGPGKQVHGHELPSEGKPSQLSAI
jgi:hypothetical protein